ncbi:hypothetical protein PoB_001921300 [Plakobranchus ocellatus]|uniref:Uncharacterized protein n=1 Tax=Plakobranchus ocellatus TaxID=259542 RepID=A0AAV3ZE35_9GAST|nr:hypothetical protein PoB_001921300 [Plakobranchus ocellatus]
MRDFPRKTTGMRTIEVARCLEDRNPVVHQDVGETQAQGIQEVGETQVPESKSRQEWRFSTDRQNENFRGGGRRSDFNGHDKFVIDSPYQAPYQRENNSGKNTNYATKFTINIHDSYKHANVKESTAEIFGIRQQQVMHGT